MRAWHERRGEGERERTLTGVLTVARLDIEHKKISKTKALEMYEDIGLEWYQ